MRHLKLIIIIVCMTSGFVVAKAQNREIVPYVDFLQNQKTHPVDYVFELFEKYDIVILGERDHRDISQYELISKIISDRRFIEKVGNIFTEIGVCNKSEQANKILKSDFESYGDFEKNLRQMYRNAEYIVTWEKYNFWELLSSIYRINRILPFEEKLNIFFTDLFFDWEAYKTKEEYSAFYDKLNSSLDYRDSIMGNNMIAGFEEILKNRDHRKKALVIYNGPHAYRRTLEKKPAAAYIFEKYPGRVTNVMINWWAFLKEGIKLLSDGKWDASFMYLNNPSLGFDFENSPFGNDKFDQYVERDTVLKYNDIYEGFIFYGGIHRWNCVVGIPDIWKDAPDVEEMLRREHHIVGNDYSVGEWKKYYNDVRNVILDDVSLDSIKAKIYSWLEDDEKSEKYILNSAY